MVLVGKYTAEVEARLLFSTQAFYIHITVWKGYGNTPMALCCHPCHLAPGELSAGLTFWLRPNLRKPLAPVGKYTAEVEARLLFATQVFYIHKRLWKGCGNTSMALCCLPPM